MDSTKAPGLRERSRLRAREEIVQAALALFAARGYRDTTVEEIAVAAGLSSRTVFRYFRSKDEIVAGSWDAFGDELAATFREQLEHEPLQDALRSTLERMVKYIDDPVERQRADVLREIAAEHPAAGAGYLQRQAAWQGALVAIARERHPEVAAADPRLDAAIGAAFAALQAAERAWRDNPAVATFSALLGTALDAFSLHPFDH